MKRLAALAAATLTLALNVQPAAGAIPTPASGVTWHPNQAVEYRWKEGAEPPAWAKSAMNAAAQDSNTSRRAKAAVFNYDAEAASWLAYTDDLPTNWAIGYTVRDIPTKFTIRMRPHGTQLDWGTLKWCEFYDGEPPNGCYDLEMVTLHEFGHAQTLGHVWDADLDSYTDSVMHTEALHSKPKIGWNQHIFGRCDVARLQIRYEPLTTSTPISTCLDMSTTVTLSTTTSSTPYGSSLAFTAKLKIASDEIYPNLAGRVLTDRTVVLQRRPIGGTTWSNVTELNAVADGTGRYVKTITLTATYDYRALFAAPSDEGLDASTSTATRVTVAADNDDEYDCRPAGALRYGPQYEIC
jgi:hypothetical protein